ncbi:hypothetical protein CVT24_008235 [Panaeolus cyanescens]|uniref:Uncharacterized protein n=1 Tax=Panaeolus cyanescens TaxID=181874 RepID=A0A409YR42_9AGAR|nr:hypothetical protein CVT24_008235 [Panaeolus cyanescens]
MSISASPKYIPVHRRTPSNGSTVASSSRPSSPVNVELTSNKEVPSATPGVYSFAALLALRPNADETIKEKMREACPEVLMNRRMKKSIQYLSSHPQARSHAHHDKQHQRPEAQPQSTPTNAVATATRQQRSLPRRNRPGRGPERRRSMLQDTWQGMRVTARQPLMVL